MQTPVRVEAVAGEGGDRHTANNSSSSTTSMMCVECIINIYEAFNCVLQYGWFPAGWQQPLEPFIGRARARIWPHILRCGGDARIMSNKSVWVCVRALECCDHIAPQYVYVIARM